MSGRDERGVRASALPCDLPALYSTEHDPDPLVRACYVHPVTGWRWFVTEYDSDRLFFGLVVGFEVELGYFDRVELEESGCWLLTEFVPAHLSVFREHQGR